MRRLNLRFLAALLTVVAVLGGGMHLIRGMQVRRNASALLDRARRAEFGEDWAKAEQALSEYLNLSSVDGAAWVSYARDLDRQEMDRRRLDRVFLVHE
jgi:hypothetical protein